jgi:antirestriction protein ArdC
MAQMDKGYESPTWASYRQWLALGAQVRAGEKSTPTYFFKNGTYEDKKSSERKKFRMERMSFLFNAAQVDGWQEMIPVPQSPSYRHNEAMKITQHLDIKWCDGEPGYIPALDMVRMPRPESFIDLDAYHNVRFHEIAHWTSHPTRLDRPLNLNMKSEAYAREELIAELSTTFLCASVGIEATRDNQAAYLVSWLRNFPDKTAALYEAFKGASKAVEYINPQPAYEEEERDAA